MTFQAKSGFEDSIDIGTWLCDNWTSSLNLRAFKVIAKPFEGDLLDEVYNSVIVSRYSSSLEYGFGVFSFIDFSKTDLKFFYSPENDSLTGKIKGAYDLAELIIEDWKQVGGCCFEWFADYFGTQTFETQFEKGYS